MIPHWEYSKTPVCADLTCDEPTINDVSAESVSGYIFKGRFATNVMSLISKPCFNLTLAYVTFCSSYFINQLKNIQPWLNSPKKTSSNKLL